MPLKSGERHWGSLAKTFHWLVVLLLIVQGAHLVLLARLDGS